MMKVEYYENKRTGERTTDHGKAVDWYNQGDIVVCVSNTGKRLEWVV